MKPDFQRVRRSNVAELLRFMKELYDHEGISWREEATLRAVEQLLNSEENGRAWFIQVDSKNIGYIVLTVAFSLEFGGRFALLDELYVQEKWTRQGIGCEALRFVEQQSRAMGAYAIRLEAGHNNSGAIHFYERDGFVREQRHLMTKRIGVSG